MAVGVSVRATIYSVLSVFQRSKVLIRVTAILSVLLLVIVGRWVYWGVRLARVAPCHHPHSVQALQEDGMPVNTRSIKNGKTLLHYAVAQDDLDGAQFLIDKGADVNSEDRSGRTPLFSRPSLQGAALLIRHGADVNHRDDQRWTVLHVCAFGSNPPMVDFLVKMGARVSATTTEGETPLHWAAIGSDARGTVALLNAGADLSAIDGFGMTPMDRAVDNGNAGFIAGVQQWRSGMAGRMTGASLP